MKQALTASLLLAVTTVAWAAPSTDEDAKVSKLIDHIAQLNGAKFQRNGDDHVAADAAKHLRRKYDSAKDDLATARDFVRECATKSSITGKAYTIKFADGTEKPCVDYLDGLLDEMEKSAAK